MSANSHNSYAPSSKGFTLIELLVVVAIIGLLASVILASLSTARQKGRDARRIADMKELSTALELYYSSQAAPGYPVSTSQANAAAALVGLVPAYMASLPDDPLGGSYHYVYKTTAGGSFYCLGTVIEGIAPASSCNTASLGSSLTGVQYSVGP